MDVPPQLYEDLHENAPQALLRDLHRPDLTWPIILRPMDLGVDTGGARARSLVHDAMQQRYSRR